MAVLCKMGQDRVDTKHRYPSLRDELRLMMMMTMMMSLLVSAAHVVACASHAFWHFLSLLREQEHRDSFGRM